MERITVVACAAVGVAIVVYMLASPYLPYGTFDNSAATIRAAKTVQDLHARYTRSTHTNAKPLSVLIVPGHEPSAGGTAFTHIWERDVVVDIAYELATQLESEPQLRIMVARNKQEWHPTLRAYFDNNWESIREWRDKNKVETARLVATGHVKETEPLVHHNAAPEDMAMRLNGINKWADENDIDIVLHLHINDYPRARTSEPGKYSGFAIYIPAPEYGNSASSREIAENLYQRLARYYPVSNLPGESAGIIEDAKLIAIGRDNSQSAASLLIEYGYIYEPQWGDALQDTTVTDVATQTYLGLQDFFMRPLEQTYASTLLPYTWDATMHSGAEGSDVLALQTALLEEGLYPPPGNTLNECPRSGKFGPCTERALRLFQQKYNIDGDGTVVGPSTRAELNARYGKHLVYE